MLVDRNYVFSYLVVICVERLEEEGERLALGERAVKKLL